jgi:putative transposase
MVEAAHHRLSISAQCRLLRISRSSYHYAPISETDETLADGCDRPDLHGVPMVWQPPDGAALAAQWAGHWTPPGTAADGEDGLTPIYQRPRTSDPHPQHRIYP